MGARAARPSLRPAYRSHDNAWRAYQDRWILGPRLTSPLSPRGEGAAVYFALQAGGVRHSYRGDPGMTVKRTSRGSRKPRRSSRGHGNAKKPIYEVIVGNIGTVY